MTSTCGKHPDAPTINEPRLYAADSRTQQIGRRGEALIKCSSPQFDEFICVRNDEYTRTKLEVIDATWECQDWGK